MVALSTLHARDEQALVAESDTSTHDAQVLLEHVVVLVCAHERHRLGVVLIEIRPQLLVDVAAVNLDGDLRQLLALARFSRCAGVERASLCAGCGRELSVFGWIG